MKIKSTLLTLFLLLSSFFITQAQVKITYHNSDSTSVPINKPITITYHLEIVDTNEIALNSFSLEKYVSLTCNGNSISKSTILVDTNSFVIIPHEDLEYGSSYKISVKPLKYKNSGVLTEQIEYEFRTNYSYETIESAYINSFQNLFTSTLLNTLPIDTVIKLESQLIPEKRSYITKEKNQIERMKAIGIIYDAMARYPDLQEKLLIQSVNSLRSIDDISPLSEDAEVERMKTLTKLFEATARQPEIVDTLNLLTDTLLGIPEDFSALCNKAKVARMESAGYMFTSIARQPEMFRTLLGQGVRYLGSINDIGNTDMETEASRMLAFGYMLESIARQPEALDSMIIVADSLLGIPQDFTIFNDEVLASRMATFRTLFESAARQPEMADTMIQQAVKYMGRFSELNTPDSLSSSMRMEALMSLWYSMARQPEVSEKLCSFVDTLMGIPDFSNLSNITHAARIKGLSTIFESIGRQPEIADTLINKTVKYMGSIDQVGSLPEKALEYRMLVFRYIAEAIARQPSMWNKIDLAADTLLGKMESFENLSEDVMRGRAIGISGLFTSIARQPEYCDTLLNLAENYLGTYDQVPTKLDDARIYAIESLVQSILRQPSYADTLDQAAESLIGVPDSFNEITDEGLAMRCTALYSLFSSYPTDEDILDNVKDIMYKYIGKWSQINIENAYSQMSRIEGSRLVFQAIDRYPEKTSELIDLYDTVMGVTNDLSLLEIDSRMKRHISLFDFYQICYQNIETNTIDSLSKAASHILGTNAQCPINTWSEAEIRMEVLSELFMQLCSRSITKEGIEEFANILEEYSGSASSWTGSNNIIDYHRQIANTRLTSWLKHNDIHDTILVDIRTRLLGSYTPEKPALYGTPSDGAVDIPVDHKLYLLFTDAMYTSNSSLIEFANIKDSIKLETQDGQAVEFDIEVFKNSRTICITPSESFTHGMKYNLLLPEYFKNYNDSLANSISNQFRIKKALLTVTADSKEMDEGSNVPELTMTFDGFIDGDTEDVIIKPEITTEATSSSSAGTYPITLTGGSSEKYSLTLVNGTLTVISTTSINNIDNSKINIYPNPVSNKLFFEQTDANISITKVEIINQLGQVIYRKLLNKEITDIDISDYKPGIYYARFCTSDNTVITKKIMKE